MYMYIGHRRTPPPRHYHADVQWCPLHAGDQEWNQNLMHEPETAQVVVGIGRIVALYYCPSALQHRSS